MSVIGNIITKTPAIIAKFIIVLIAFIISIITIEPGTKGTLTKRKFRRIRFLTKVKMFLLNIMPDPVCKFLGFLDYKNYLKKHFSYGV